MKPLAQTIASIAPSMTLAVNDKAKAMQAAGEDVIVLAGGDPDFDTPRHIVAAMFAAIEAGHTHYPSPMAGIPAALEAVAAKMERDNGVSIADPRRQVILTPGGKWALYLALAALVNPGDEVLYMEPAWVSYEPMLTLIGAQPVPLPLAGDDNFQVTAAAIRARVTPRTKAILINTPCNPTGRVLSRAELEAIAAVAQEADLYLVADEIYEKLVFDGRDHISIASLPGMAERTVTVSGLTKSYAMTGWRMGWLAGPAPVVAVATKLNGHSVSCAATFTMYALIAALEGPQDAVAEMRDAYQARRDFMVKALNEIEGVECRSIEGAFYLFPRFPGSTRNSLELAEALLELGGIAGTPGIAFGESGEGHVRFSIATGMDELERAVERLAKIAPQL